MTMFNPQPHIDEQRYEALAAKAASGAITQAELDEAQALVDEAARSSIRIPAPLTDGEKWADKVMAEKIQSGDLPNLGPGFSDSLRAARALIEIADKKLFMRTKYGSSGLHARKYPVPYLPVKIKKFWEDVNKRATDVIVSEDKIFDLDLSPFVSDNDGYLIPLSERFKETSPDIRHNPRIETFDLAGPGMKAVVDKELELYAWHVDALGRPLHEEVLGRNDIATVVVSDQFVGIDVSKKMSVDKVVPAVARQIYVKDPNTVVEVTQRNPIMGNYVEQFSLSDIQKKFGVKIDVVDSNPPDDDWFIRYTRSDGTGLMHRSAFDMDLLDLEEEYPIEEI